jgi:leader peptidase (prepilin peptidase) / N-methyltransferase
MRQCTIALDCLPPMEDMSHGDAGDLPPMRIALLLAALVALPSFLLLEPVAATVSCGFGLAMAAIAYSDARRFIVPDRLSLPAIPAGLLASGLFAAETPAHAAMLSHLAAAVTGALALLAIREVYAALRGREGMGLGDVKLAAVAGSWTGFAGLPLVLLLACLGAMAAVLAASMRGSTSITATTAVPLGATLAPAIWLVWLAHMAGLPI